MDPVLQRPNKGDPDTPSIAPVGAPLPLPAGMEHIVCDLCGADDPRLVLTARDYNYHLPGVFFLVQCCQCKLVYLDPRPDGDHIGGYYPDEGYTCFKYEGDVGTLSGDHPFQRAVERFSFQPGVVCDIGCGTGDFLLAARNSGWSVCGVEPNDYARARANDRLATATVFPSLTEAVTHSDPWDAITLWHVLEHLPSPRVAIEQSYAALRPGGILVVALPNFGSLERWIWRGRWIAIMAPTHLYHFTSDTLTVLLKAAGFTDLEISHSVAPNSLAANILRTGRELVLDPLAQLRKTRYHPGMQNASPDSLLVPNISLVTSETQQHFELDDSTKADFRDRATRLVYPAAWLAARLGFGPELVVAACKPLSDGAPR